MLEGFCDPLFLDTRVNDVGWLRLVNVWISVFNLKGFKFDYLRRVLSNDFSYDLKTLIGHLSRSESFFFIL